jgi:flagellar hook-basal body complex protein FliE
MVVNFVAANAAYQAANRTTGAATNGAAGGAAGASDPASGASFGDALADALKNATNTMRAGETAAAQGVAGQKDIVQVVNAVTAAELTLQTVVAIRDKVISAYEDIMKMPI